MTTNLLYVVVHDYVINNSSAATPCSKSHQNLQSNFRYTRPVLQNTLQFIGCKPRHAFKISKHVFEHLSEEVIFKPPDSQGTERFMPTVPWSHEELQLEQRAAVNVDIVKRSLHPEMKGSCVIVDRNKFIDTVCNSMSEYRYVGVNQRNDLAIACKIREKQTSVTILLCGTSGCGKSTLSTLLANRLGITTVVSTDSIRHMMRSFSDEKENPLLWASTYSAGEHLDPIAVAESKMKKKIKKGPGLSKLSSCFPTSENKPIQTCGVKETEDMSSSSGLVLNSRVMALQGYEAQSEMVMDSLDRLITSWELKCESVIVEGVHLTLNFVMELMKKHPSVIPFMVYIRNEEKHIERFAVRAKYMTLDPAGNKYVKYIRNIRTIQDYQCRRADKHRVPQVNNTNMDRSVACIHATIFACLRRKDEGEAYYDKLTNTARMVYDEYKKQLSAAAQGCCLGSKRMLRVIQRKGSLRQVVALMNHDGSFAKTNNLEVFRKTINLQFGKFGLSAWSSSAEAGETSSCAGNNNGVMDTLTGFNHYFVSSSNQWYGQAATKQLLNETRILGSEEEQDDEVLEPDSEDLDGKDHQYITDVEEGGTVGDRRIGSYENDEEHEDGFLESPSEHRHLCYYTTTFDEDTSPGTDNVLHFNSTFGCKPLSIFQKVLGHSQYFSN